MKCRVISALLGYINHETRGIAEIEDIIVLMYEQERVKRKKRNPLGYL